MKFASLRKSQSLNSKNQTTHQSFFKIGIHATLADATDLYFCKLVPMCAENIWLYSIEVSMAVYSSSASSWFLTDNVFWPLVYKGYICSSSHCDLRHVNAVFFHLCVQAVQLQNLNSDCKFVTFNLYKLDQFYSCV